MSCHKIVNRIYYKEIKMSNRFYGLVIFIIGILSLFVCDGDVTFLLFSVILGVVLVSDKVKQS